MSRFLIQRLKTHEAGQKHHREQECCSLSAPLSSPSVRRGVCASRVAAVPSEAGGAWGVPSNGECWHPHVRAPGPLGPRPLTAAATRWRPLHRTALPGVPRAATRNGRQVPCRTTAPSIPRTGRRVGEKTTSPGVQRAAPPPMLWPAARLPPPLPGERGRSRRGPGVGGSDVRSGGVWRSGAGRAERGPGGAERGRWVRWGPGGSRRSGGSSAHRR